MARTRMGFAGMRGFGVLFLGFALLFVCPWFPGCTLPSDLLSDLSCPCGQGWECDELRGVCVEDGPGRDIDMGECLIPVSDDFEDGTVDSDKWRFVSDDNATVTEEDGEFVATVPANSVSDYAFLITRERVDLTRCALFGELVVAEPSATAETIFNIRITNDESLGWNLRASELRGYSRVRGSVNATIVELSYDPVAHRWLGIRGTGETMLWLTSPDGVDWTVQGQRPPDFSMEDVELIFGLGALDDGSEIVSRFDNINLDP
ncbi:MAG: hypothetical protein AAGF12_22185 [Myxococcota bacterium]